VSTIHTQKDSRSEDRTTSAGNGIDDVGAVVQNTHAHSTDMAFAFTTGQDGCRARTFQGECVFESEHCSELLTLCKLFVDDGGSTRLTPSLLMFAHSLSNLMRQNGRREQDCEFSYGKISKAVATRLDQLKSSVTHIDGAFFFYLRKCNAKVNRHFET